MQVSYIASKLHYESKHYLCSRQWNEVPSCVASLNLVDPCIDLVLAANETLFHLEVSFSGICSEVILPEMTTSDTILETTTYPVCQNERADFSACVDTFLDLINNLTAAHWMNDTIIEVICRYTILAHAVECLVQHDMPVLSQQGTFGCTDLPRFLDHNLR